MALKDFKILTKDTLIYGIGNASNRIIQVLLAPLYAAYLSADRFGVRALVTALYGILQIIIVLALDQGVIADFYKAKTPEERRTVISTGFTFSIISSFLIGGLLFILAAPVARMMGLDLVEGVTILRLFAVFTSFTPPTFVFLSFLRSEQRPWTYSIFSFFKSLAKVGLLVIFLVVLRRELIGIFEADAVLAVVFFPVLLIFVYVYTRGVKFSLKSLGSMLLYSLPLIPSAAFGWIRNLSDRFLIKMYLTQADVGIFSFAVNFPNMLSFILVVPLFLAWIPYAFSVKDKPELPQLISRVLTYFLFFAGWALIILGGPSYEILRLIAKRPEYWQGAPLIPLLLLGICAYGSHYIIATPCNLARKTIYFTIITLISAAVSLLANIILLPRIGLIGSAVASFLSYSVMLLPMYFFSRRLMKIPYEIRRIVMIMVASLVITVISFSWQPQVTLTTEFLTKIGLAWITHLWYPSSALIGLLLKIGVGTLLYFAGLFLLGFLLPSERQFLLNRLQRRRRRRG